MFRASLAILATAIASPALADAVTYQGTLGKIPVVVELSIGIEAATETVVGRYFYPNKGIDIPLDAVSVEPGKLEMTEEIPCPPDVCDEPFANSTFPEEVRGAAWSMESTDDGETIVGSWQNASGKPLKISLTRVGSRELNDVIEVTQPANLMLSTWDISGGKKPFTMETDPYDFLRTDVKFDAEPETRWGPVAFTYVTDPRTKFRFPRVIDLGGVALEPANTRLATDHAMMNIDALGCEGQQHFSMGWTPGMEYSANTYAGYPDETVEVTYLSPTVMSWTESGSLFCGGAYPENHSNAYNIDVTTGKDLDLSLIFADSTQGEYRWQPGPSLIQFVREHRVREADSSWEDECGIDELIPDYLAVTFKQDDIAVFTLQGLPHVITACGGPLYEAPLLEISGLLNYDAQDYFPVLAD